MKREEILDLLRQTGAMLDEPETLADGRVFSFRVRPPKLTQFAPFNRRLCYEIVRHYLELDVHVVVALDVPSIPVAVEVGRQLETRAIHLASTDADVLEHGFELHHGERVLLVIDRIVSNDQVIAATRLVRRSGARLIGIGSLVDMRGGALVETVKDITAISLSDSSEDVGVGR
jgi:orotate phosphoribosyltransferase